MMRPQNNTANYWNLYAKKKHTHDEYASKSHMHSDYANTNHTHDDKYSNKTHTHSEYIKNPSGVAFDNPNTNTTQLVTTRNILFNSGRQKVVLGANVFNDTMNDVHHDKSVGCSQIVMNNSDYPKFRWSNAGDPQYGIAQWGSYYDMLTTYAGQGVIYDKKKTITNGNNMNNYTEPGVYFVSSTTGTIINLPTSAYGYGILMVYKSGEVTLQMYIKDGQSTSEIFTRICWGTSWRPWFRFFSDHKPTYYNGTSTLEEKQLNTNIYDEKIKSLEERIERLEAMLNNKE